MPIPPKSTHQRRNPIFRHYPIVFTRSIPIRRCISPFSTLLPNHSPPSMKITCSNPTTSVQFTPIPITRKHSSSQFSTHPPLNPFHSIQSYSLAPYSIHPLQIPPFHLITSLPRNPQRMHNKHSKQS